MPISPDEAAEVAATFGLDLPAARVLADLADTREDAETLAARFGQRTDSHEQVNTAIREAFDRGVTHIPASEALGIPDTKPEPDHKPVNDWIRSHRD